MALRYIIKVRQHGSSQYIVAVRKYGSSHAWTVLDEDDVGGELADLGDVCEALDGYMDRHNGAPSDQWEVRVLTMQGQDVTRQVASRFYDPYSDTNSAWVADIMDPDGDDAWDRMSDDEQDAEMAAQRYDRERAGR